MKKSLLLGAAALAAVALAPAADAGQVSFGGYYRFQVLSQDYNVTEERAGQDEYEAMRHRLHLKMDMSVSPKTHAHMVFRPIDNHTVEGANSSFLESQIGANASSGRVDTGGTLNIMQAWLETEMWGVGVKVGEMPLQLNDRVLVNDDGDSSMGGILLSKTFPNKITAIAGKFALDENNAVGRSIGDTDGVNPATRELQDAGDDDLDLYMVGLLGSTNGVNWNATLAYLKGYDDAVMGNTGAGHVYGWTNVNEEGDTNNIWAALTLSGKFNNVDWVLTGIYENGYDNIATNSGIARLDQMEGAGGMVALRLNGKVGWGEWNAYGFYGSDDFNSINNRPNWSMLYDHQGTDLLHNVLLATDQLNGSAPHANDSGENAWGLGVGAQFKAGIWTINPQLDVVRINEEDYRTGGLQQRSAIRGAWGGTLKASTQVDTATTFSVVGSYVDVQENDNILSNSAGGQDDMHVLMAEIRMNF